MQKERLVLKDGTEIIGGFASKSSRNQLMIKIPGNNLVEAAINFNDPNKTSEIICYYSINKTTYIGYTDMYSVQYFADGDYVEIWLQPAEGAETSVTKEITVPAEYVPGEVPSQEKVEEESEEEVTEDA